MKLLKEKLLLFSPFIVCLVVLIFSLTLIPSVHPPPQHLPIAIVNEDQGADMPNQGNINAGAAIVRNIKDVQKANHDGTSAVKWVEIKNEKTAREGLNDRKYYAALLIPKDFSRKQASLQTPNPSGAKMTVLVNQGANPIAANAAGQIVNQGANPIAANAAG
ncbi:YhgE/Pip domain-containing protein, partial [Bacillus sonorensis]